MLDVAGAVVIVVGTENVDGISIHHTWPWDKDEWVKSGAWDVSACRGWDGVVPAPGAEPCVSRVFYAARSKRWEISYKERFNLQKTKLATKFVVGVGRVREIFVVYWRELERMRKMWRAAKCERARWLWIWESECWDSEMRWIWRDWIELKNRYGKWCNVTSPHGNLFQKGLSDKPPPNGLYKPIPERFMYKPINKDHTPAGFIFYIPHRCVYYKPIIK